VEKPEEKEGNSLSIPTNLS